MALVLAVHCCQTDAMPKPLRPLQKKGAGAWANEAVQPAVGRRAGGVNRLQAHAVDDKTNEVYARAVRDFLAQMKREGCPFETADQRDRATAGSLSDLCYVKGCSRSRATQLASGFLHIYPEHKGKMTETGRCLVTWERFGFSFEGAPIWTGTIAAAALRMIQRGDLYAAVAVWLSEDAYLREQDWIQLVKGDVCWDREYG